VFGFVTHFLFALLRPILTIVIGGVGGGVGGFQSGETNFTASIAISLRNERPLVPTNAIVGSFWAY